MIVKAEVCVPFGMNAVAGDLRAERVIRKCVCGPVVGRAQVPADRIEDGLCFLFGFGERGGSVVSSFLTLLMSPEVTVTYWA